MATLTLRLGQTEALVEEAVAARQAALQQLETSQFCASQLQRELNEVRGLLARAREEAVAHAAGGTASWLGGAQGGHAVVQQQQLGVRAQPLLQSPPRPPVHSYLQPLLAPPPPPQQPAAAAGAQAAARAGAAGAGAVSPRAGSAGLVAPAPRAPAVWGEQGAPPRECEDEGGDDDDDAPPLPAILRAASKAAGGVAGGDGGAGGSGGVVEDQEEQDRPAMSLRERCAGLGGRGARWCGGGSIVFAQAHACTLPRTRMHVPTHAQPTPLPPHTHIRRHAAIVQQEAAVSAELAGMQRRMAGEQHAADRMLALAQAQAQLTVGRAPSHAHSSEWGRGGEEGSGEGRVGGNPLAWVGACAGAGAVVHGPAGCGAAPARVPFPHTLRTHVCGRTRTRPLRASALRRQPARLAPHQPQPLRRRAPLHPRVPLQPHGRHSRAAAGAAALRAAAQAHAE